MNQKPLKRNNYLLPVSKEHHFGLLFCWKIRRGVELRIDAGRITQYVETFWRQHLHPHFTEEENVLFMNTADTLVHKALEEHATLKELVQQVIKTAGSTTPEQLTVLADTLDKHIRFEERTVFPHLERTFTATQVNHIASRLLHSGNVQLKDNYADEFWKHPGASL